MAHLGQSYGFRVINKNSSGALANGTVTALLLRNGVDSGETVTVSNQSTGRYLISATIPSGWTLEDIAQLEVTVDSVPSLIWGEKVVARPATTDQASNIYSVVQLTDADVASIKTTVEGLVAAIWSAGTRTLTAISDSSGVTQLLTRITGLLQTKAQADAAFAAIQAKTDLINSSNANQQRTPVTTLRIVRGDTFTGTVPVTTDYTGKTGTFTIRHRVTNAVLLTSNNVTVNSPTQLQIDLAYEDTLFPLLVQPSEFGPHPYDIEMMGGGDILSVQGVAVIVQDVTVG